MRPIFFGNLTEDRGYLGCGLIHPELMVFNEALIERCRIMSSPQQKGQKPTMFTMEFLSSELSNYHLKKKGFKELASTSNTDIIL